MIIYNVTIKVEHAIAAPFIQWMKEEHIPDIINTGCFTHTLIYHLMEADDEDGITYAVQYHAKDYAHYKKYIDQFSESMRKIVIDKWGNQFIAFRTVMRAVN
jgi:hypothetical protein